MRPKSSSFGTLSLVIGVIAAVAALVGFILFSLVFNQGTVPIVVAVRDIPSGTVVTRDMLGIDDMKINPQSASVLVQESELGIFVGGVTAQVLYAYQPVPKAAIVAEGNPASSSRLALALTDPTIVAMVVPVNRETSPENLAEGDYVDLNFGVGSATFLAGTLSTAPTPFPFQPLPNVFVTQPPVPLPPTLTPPAEPRLTLPIAKTLVHAARVLSVVYDEAPNPGYAGPSSGQPATIRGDIIALVVAVPKEVEEVLHFAIVNGSIRVALLSPNGNWETGEIRQPTLGMSWDDMVALFRLDREQILAAGLPSEIVGPGAAAIKATLDAQGAAPVVLPPATATQAPTATAGP